MNMMTASVLLGVGSIPFSKPAALAWLKRMKVSYIEEGGRFLFVGADLPAPERRAYLAQAAEQAGLELGQYDDAAQASFLQAPASMQAEAERRAAIACRLVQLVNQEAIWSDRISIIQQEFGPRGTSEQSLRRLLRAVKGVDPINFAPALIAGYKLDRKRAETSPIAWSMFITLIRDAAPDFPLTQAWRDVRDVSKVKGWEAAIARRLRITDVTVGRYVEGRNQPLPDRCLNVAVSHG